jgi:hypothetical protein
VTTYVLLHRVAQDALDADAKTAASASWAPLPKTYEAASNTAAVRAAAADVQQPGEYVAIPARSFDPVTIEIETNPRVKVVK